MTVTLEISDRYATLLTLTAVGVTLECGLSINANCHSVDLSKHNYVVLDENGQWRDLKLEE